MNKLKNKIITLIAIPSMLFTLMPTVAMPIKAETKMIQLQSVKSVEKDSKEKNVVWVTFNDKTKGKITFLENNIFRYNVDPSGDFEPYAEVRKGYPDTAKIQQYPDDSDEYKKPSATVSGKEISAGDITISFDKDAKMTVKIKDKVVMEEQEALKIDGDKTVQTLVQHKKTNYSDIAENYFGGGTQNGRFLHTGKSINIANESSWTDGGVSSPNPFYYTTNGYGVLRNTYQNGKYDFGASTDGTVTTVHEENEFDAYYFLSDKDNGSEVSKELLQSYFKVTGNPTLLPEYGFYLGHLNAYNRDAWSENGPGTKWEIKGNGPSNEAGATVRYEQGGTGYVVKEGQIAETLNGTGPTIFTDKVPNGVTYDRKFSAQAILDEYLDMDVPFGYFLPNDGYGAGYGQNGFNMTGGVNADGTSSADRLAAVAANVENLKEFSNYADSRGIATGLWTQSNLTPDSNPNTFWHILRDFEAEVKAGVTTLKTDVAWVGNGYSFQLSGVKQAHNIITTMKYDDGRKNTRPNIISLDGWAGSQRYNSVWTGDQTGGDWEYIRFHIPTFIGQSMSGNPNVGSDMDGIWGGNPLIATRDYQWKSFAPQLLDMDGWGSFMKSPYAHGDPYTGVSRMYLKLKAQMMPYIYTNAYAASNIDTKNGDQGLPMVRAMMLEYPEEAIANSLASQYQYMWGGNLLVAPVYQDTDGDSDKNNDIRNNIYLPDENETWIDYFTGEQYRGGQTLNNFDAPLWKLPLFVKNGSIIPMYEEHNVADSTVKNGVDKSKRIVEFWPAGETQFNTFEDDGTYIENNQDTSDKAYGSIDNVSYGNHVETLYTSKVEGNTATLTANKGSGSYEGYDKNKDTTFVVNVSQQPDSIDAYNGSNKLSEVNVASKAEFDKAVVEAGKVVTFYDANPEIETYASDEEVNLKAMVDGVKVSPKLYVKFANVDAQENAQKLVINGFVNDGKLDADKLNNALEVPTLSENEELKTPTSISLEWNKVDDATSYELLVDGKLFGVGNKLTFRHENLEFKSEHTYQIRSRNASGYSKWSEEVKYTSADDPFLNTPKPVSIDWTGDIWGSHGADLAFDEIFQTGDGGFHSNNGGVNEKLTVDYGNAYLFDTVEYYPRTDVGNGTVTEMKVETSLDGVHWIQHGDQTKADGTKYYKLAVDATTKNLNLKDENVNSETIGARYIRFTALASLGTFFSASEIKPIAVEYGQVGSTTKPFSVGNISTLGTAAATQSSYESMYAKESSAHSSYKNPNWRGEIQAVYGDINFNGYSDVYDYAFTAFKVDGGTTKKGKVSGAITLDSDKQEIKAGETFTINVTADNVKNLNAYGSIIHYDPAKVEYVNSSYSDMVGNMYTKGMTKSWVYDDGTAFVNHNAMNMGDQELVNGSGVLSSITMRAKQNIVLNDVTEPSSKVKNNDFIIDLSTTTLVGPDYSFINYVKGSEVDETLKYTADDFNITLTNNHLPTDDGSNLGKLIQQNSYDGLFNGTIGREFEFKWNIDSNFDETGKLPEYISLPLTMHLDLKDPSLVEKIVVANANKGNGYLSSAKAKLIYTDGSASDEIIISEEKSNYEFIFNPDKPVQRIDITFLSAIDSGGNPVNNMLTLAEMEITGKPYKEEIIEFGKDDFDFKLTNEFLPEDDGSNLEKLIQQNSYDGLFNGKNDREFEFKWDTDSNYDETGKLPEYIKLPLTMNLALKEPALIDKVVVHNANKGNGYLTSAKAQLIYTDGTKSDEIVISEESEAYTFEFTPEKNVASIDIVYLSATGSVDNNMLTVGELEIAGRKAKEEVVNKGALQVAVNEAKAMDKTGYTPASVGALNNAIEAGEAVLNNPEATQQDVDAAENAISAAVAGLTDSANTDALEKALERANTVDRDIHSAESIAILDTAIANANDVVVNKNATQQQVDDALVALNNAISGLVLDKSGLNDLVINAEGLDLTNKTADSVLALKNAIRVARNVLINENATAEDIRAAIDGLSAAMEGLVEGTTPIDPDNGNSSKPDNGSGSNTGDTTNRSALGCMLLLAGGVIVVSSKKKFKKSK